MIPLLLLLALPVGFQDEEVLRWVEELAAEDISRREEAQNRLLKLGKKAIPALEKASQSPDAERASRAAETIRLIYVDAATVEELKQALRDSFASEREYHKNRMTALQEEAARLKTWIDRAYADRLEGLITPEEFREKSGEWRNRQLEIQNEVRAHTVADGKYLEEAERILDLAQRAHAIYVEEDDNFKRRELVDLVVSKVVISDNRAVSNLWEPFSALSKVAVAAKSPDRSSQWWAFGYSRRNNSPRRRAVPSGTSRPTIAAASTAARSSCSARSPVSSRASAASTRRSGSSTRRTSAGRRRWNGPSSTPGR